MTWSLAVVAFLLGTFPSSSAQPTGVLRSGMVEIDGKKNPEMIPDYLVWGNSFRVLVGSRADGLDVVDATLRMSAEDKQRLYPVAEAQVREQNACLDAQDRAQSEALGRGETSTQIRDRIKGMELECRQKTLDARDKLLQQLTPEGRAALTEWVNRARESISALVPKNELDHFRRPG